MRIGIQPWDTDGEIRPFIALAGGLSSAGHDVTIAVTSADNKDYSDLGEVLDFRGRSICHLDYNKDQIWSILVG